MPLYTYHCKAGHEFDKQASYDTEAVKCEGMEPWGAKGSSQPDEWIECRYLAHRQAVYRDQGVIFKGPGFTKAVYPPPPPEPKSTLGLKSDDAVGELDTFAQKRYQYDENVLPIVKEMREQGEEGG